MPPNGKTGATAFVTELEANGVKRVLLMAYRLKPLHAPRTGEQLPMRGITRLIVTIGLLGIASVPVIAAVPPEPPASPLDAHIPMAIAQPLGARAPVLRTPVAERTAMLPEPGMLVLVGSALLGLAAIVRKTT